MNQAVWIAKKNQICSLIKKISDHYGRDEIDWLREYAKEVIEGSKDNIQKALDCFWDVEAQLKCMPRRVIRGTFGGEEAGVVAKE